MGILTAGGLATSISADKMLLWEVPRKWSLEQAATIPVAYGVVRFFSIITVLSVLSY